MMRLRLPPDFSDPDLGQVLDHAALIVSRSPCWECTQTLGKTTTYSIDEAGSNNWWLTREGDTIRITSRYIDSQLEQAVMRVLAHVWRLEVLEGR